MKTIRSIKLLDDTNCSTKDGINKMVKLLDTDNKWFIPVDNEVYELNGVQYIGKNGRIEKC